MSSIRRRLTGQLLLTFAILLGAGGLGVYLSTRTALLRQFDTTLRAKAMAIMVGTEQEHGRIRVEVPGRLMTEFAERSTTDYFQMWWSGGTTIKRSASLHDLDLPFQPGAVGAPVMWNVSLASGLPGRAVVFRFLPRGAREDGAERPSGEPADLVLVVASDRHGLDRTLAVLGLMLSASGVLLLSATILVVPRVLQRELSPLHRLGEQAMHIRADSLAMRFPTEALPEELAPITARLNDLVARLERSFERERQFSADLAHELRTPIAELRSLAELALKWPETRPPDTDDDALMIAKQMEGLVTRLLTLLRSEQGQLAVVREPVSLAPLLKRVWRPFAERAATRNLPVIWSVPDAAEIQSDPILLSAILTNLIENAVEYASPGGALEIEVEVGSDRFVVRVTNPVDQITEAELPKLFDRFWRRDAARRGTEHSGLGLSLARTFAEALGAQLTAAFIDERRLRFTLTGPIRGRVVI